MYAQYAKEPLFIRFFIMPVLLPASPASVELHEAGLKFEHVLASTKTY